MDESLGSDMDVEQQLPVFIQCSSSNVVSDWKQKFAAGTLSITDFKEHWKIWVPHLLSPEPKSSCLDWSFDEDKVQKVLFDSLEEFICDGLPEEIFQKVSQMDNPPSVCGRVFKMGEPTYNCRECGMDATCVLCVDCFKKSTHRHHKYKMGTSNAGGCCDCGDVEAWKKEPYCDVHIIGTQKRHEAGSILPPDLAERARLTFSSVLRYAYQLLTTDYGPGNANLLLCVDVMRINYLPRIMAQVMLTFSYVLRYAYQLLTTDYDPGAEESELHYHLGRSHRRCPKTLSSPTRVLTESSQLNEFTLYSHDYTKDTDRRKLQDDSRISRENGFDGEEGGLSFVRLLKRELSRKKILENGTLTEEYKDNYFHLVELNQTLTKRITQIKSKMKHYKQVVSDLNDKHEEEMKMYNEQVEDMKRRLGGEKIQLEKEKNEVERTKNEIREMNRRIGTGEKELQRVGEALHTAETEVTYKTCEIVTVSETCESYKKRLLQVYKEMEAVRDNTKTFAQTKKMFQDKIQHLVNTNEKVKTLFEQLLLDNETFKLESQSLHKVLHAHENICLQLLKIAADKLDSHNDERVMIDMRNIMRHLDENKEKLVKQMEKIAINRKHESKETNDYEIHLRHMENGAAGVDLAQYKVMESSIPLDLKVPPEDVLQITYSHNSDNFCTVLYNDEFHTFEHVINTLVRSLKCSQKDAIEFVTNIDREGRAAVKCSNFSHCEDLKSEIERFTSRHGNRPIKVAVVNSVVVAHQIYAMRLLTWLQKLLGYSESFRILFSEVSLEEKAPELSIVEGILIKDSQLWKAARLHWHRLFISGMLMEYESKKAFARVFTKKYGAIMKDFIRDDHDHSFSVGSMAVQIYTVPTLAHYLIASEDVLFILLSTFISECTRKLNKKKKLEFERNLPNAHFKRAQYILYDLRYLLGVPPDTWTPELRQGFLHGLNFLLDLLSYMQGMDEVTRQVGQHMEYEPEWESAFNLHIKLAPVITLFLQWCGTDKEILVKAYRATMRQLCADESLDLGQLGEVREVGDHSVACLHYDVSTQPVSIHLPLSRFLAGLYIHLHKFGLSFNSPDLISDKIVRLTPEQLLEPVLRTQVMISQVHAGMWRRNGYSLLNQIYFYHNVKCRNEMLDKDIILLQIGASLIESNEFLIHLLNKFNLINWVTPNFEQTSLRSPEEESIRPTISLVEEFLHLLILITGERFMPGIGKVTSDDCIKKEVIQQLCIKPLPHSELNKALPDDSNHETGLERVINEIADFKKPVQSSGKGVYELKPDLYERYNVFFYHYSREEVSRSEEEQRKRRKANKELECVPPPKLPALMSPFSMVTNLLQCDVMLHIMSLVLERSINLRARSFSESQLHKILHLIGYALHEEESGNYQFFMFTDRAEKFNLEQHIEELCTSPRVEAHKDLLTWTLAKFRSVSAPRRRAAQTESLPSATDNITSTPDTAHNVAPAENEEDVKARQAEKEKRAKLAAERRAKVMAQMQAQQNSFMKENAKLFEENASPAKQQEPPCPEDQESTCMDIVENPVALGPNQTPRPSSSPLTIRAFCVKKNRR
ncbi:hypothetical protein WDU94_011775 [Cyamophila willieti]